MGFRPDEVTLAPSRQLRCWLGALHLVAAFAVAFSQLSWPLVAALWLALALSALRADRRYGRPGGTGVSALRWESTGLSLQLAEGGWLPVTLTPATRLFSFALLLELESASGQRWRLPLWRDALPAAQFRRLRVELRYRLQALTPQS